MQPKYSVLFKIIHFLGDIFIVNIAFFIAFQVKFSDVILSPQQSDRYLVLLVVFNIFWVFAASFLRIYELFRVIQIERVVENLIKTVLLHMLLVSIFIVALKGFYYSREFLFYYYLFEGIYVILFRLMFMMYIRQTRSKGDNIRNVVIVGGGTIGKSTAKMLDTNPNYGYNFLGFFDDDRSVSVSDGAYLGSIDDLYTYASQHKIDEIFCALPLASTKLIRFVKKFADNNLIRFKLVPDFRGFYNRKVVLEHYNTIPVLVMRKEPLENPLNSFVKRVFDFIFSLLAVVLVLSWLVLIIGVLIKISSRGPVFFKQRRSGKDNREFAMWKFRTMKENKEADEKQATEGDDRITKIGAFLRKTSLDEFPQFINVLIGDMSIVGPRPHMLKHTKEYAKLIDKFMVRHLVKPGITGLAQIKGYRGTTIDPIEMEKRIRTDIFYVENWSFLLDVKIILMTIIHIFKKDNNAV